jgi:hypothetical protein
LKRNWVNDGKKTNHLWKPLKLPRNPKNIKQKLRSYANSFTSLIWLKLCSGFLGNGVAIAALLYKALAHAVEVLSPPWCRNTFTGVPPRRTL